MVWLGEKECTGVWAYLKADTLKIQLRPLEDTRDRLLQPGWGKKWEWSGKTGKRGKTSKDESRKKQLQPKGRQDYMNSLVA